MTLDEALIIARECGGKDIDDMFLEALCVLAAEVRKRQWIPVAERVPEQMQEVRFITASGQPFCGWYDGMDFVRGEKAAYDYFKEGMKRKAISGIYCKGAVKVWHSLPAPPEAAP